MRQLKTSPPSGFSLIELMVVLAIVGILAAFGVPFMNSTVSNNRVTSAADQLAASFRLARAEAVSTGILTSVCASATGTSCSGSWVTGWIVCHNVGGAACTAADVVQAVVPSTSLTFSAGAPTQVTFNSLGAVSATAPAGGVGPYVFDVTGSGSTSTSTVSLAQRGSVTVSVAVAKK